MNTNLTTHGSYLIALFAMTVALIYFYNQNKQHKAASERKDTIIAEKSDSIRYERNRAGQEVASKTAALATVQEVRQAYQAEIKALREELGIRDRNLRAFMRAELQARGEGTAEIHNHYYTDSTGAQVTERGFQIDDGYLDLEAAIDSTEVHYEYTYTDEILAAFHVERKWLLGKERLMWSGRLANPNARITSTTNVLVEEAKDKRWCVTVGAGFDPFSGKLFPSIGVGYAVFKF